jgi:hypothetical protein
MPMVHFSFNPFLFRRRALRGLSKVPAGVFAVALIAGTTFTGVKQSAVAESSGSKGTIALSLKPITRRIGAACDTAQNSAVLQAEELITLMFRFDRERQKLVSATQPEEPHWYAAGWIRPRNNGSQLTYDFVIGEIFFISWRIRYGHFLKDQAFCSKNR